MGLAFRTGDVWIVFSGGFFLCMKPKVLALCGKCSPWRVCADGRGAWIRAVGGRMGEGEGEGTIACGLMMQCSGSVVMKQHEGRDYSK